MIEKNERKFVMLKEILNSDAFIEYLNNFRLEKNEEGKEFKKLLEKKFELMQYGKNNDSEFYTVVGKINKIISNVINRGCIFRFQKNIHDLFPLLFSSRFIVSTRYIPSIDMILYDIYYQMKSRELIQEIKQEEDLIYE